MDLLDLPKDCLYEIFIHCTNRSKCKLGKTCRIFNLIKNEYIPMYIRSKWPLVFPYIKVEMYHDALYVMTKHNKTQALGPFFNKLDCGRILYLCVHGAA